jgi:hypothetical protein
MHDKSPAKSQNPHMSARPTPHSRSRPSQPCKFYNSAEGCLNGYHCAFLHILVVPPSVNLVDKPRPWRTRPCRHFQFGRCNLGDACHYAHVYDGTGDRMPGAGNDDDDSEDDVEIVSLGVMLA